MSNLDKSFLDAKCKEIRRLLIQELGSIGSGHAGGSLSVVEALVVLHYAVMQGTDPKNPKVEGRDRLVISKGHAGPTLYAILADRGFFPKEELATLNAPNTNLPSHCDMNRTPGVDMTAGSLGQGISCAVGLAMGSKLKKDGATIFAIVGDGESQEGQVWESAMIANQYKLNNLIAFTDYNKLQIDGTVDEVSSLEPITDKWKAFGWNVLNVVDGNDVEQIYDAIICAKHSDRPSMIILNTVKGKGISAIEKLGGGNHHMVVSPELVAEALQELA